MALFSLKNMIVVSSKIPNSEDAIFISTYTYSEHPNTGEQKIGIMEIFNNRTFWALFTEWLLPF